MAMRISTVEILTEKAHFEPQVAVAVAEAIDEAIEMRSRDSQWVTVPILDARLAELKTELKGDIAELKTELKGDIAELKTEFKSNIAELKTEFTGSIANLKTEFTGSIANLKSELTGDIANLKSELTGDIANLKSELTGNIAAVNGKLPELATSVLHRVYFAMLGQFVALVGVTYLIVSLAVSHAAHAPQVTSP